MRHDEMWRQVYEFVRDAPAEFVQPDEVTNWLNEGMLDIADRTGILKTEDVGVVTDNAIDLPADYLRLVTLWLGEEGNESEMVPPLHDHMVGDFIEDFEVFDGAIHVREISDGTAYRLRYVRRPALLEDPEDDADLPRELLPKVIWYARAQALYKEREDAMADRYMQRYLETLPPHPNAEMRNNPGPKSLVPVKGPFETW